MDPMTTLIAHPARHASLPALLAPIAAACEAAGLPTIMALRAELATEELFANTVMHGYGGESDALVWLRVEPAGPQGLTIEYQDACPPFNPLVERTDAATAALPRTHGLPGGLGRLLLTASASQAIYERREEKNCTRLHFAPS
jgi:serine/threonine-protein kinase RsbW